jgi:hypothetical protein
MSFQGRFLTRKSCTPLRDRGSLCKGRTTCSVDGHGRLHATREIGSCQRCAGVVHGQPLITQCSKVTRCKAFWGQLKRYRRLQTNDADILGGFHAAGVMDKLKNRSHLDPVERMHAVIKFSCIFCVLDRRVGGGHAFAARDQCVDMGACDADAKDIIGQRWNDPFPPSTSGDLIIDS